MQTVSTCAMMDVLSLFSAACRLWFDESFAQPTAVQAAGWAAIARREHALLLAPTGSGKTLAAFLAAIDQLTLLPNDALPGTRVVYVSPLKALVYDIERNLRAPLVGVMRCAQRLGHSPHLPTIGIRTGDTPAKERDRQRRNPPDILVTTPESLFLLLASKAQANLKEVSTIIVDEVHAIAPSKRGAHLALSLERLSAACSQDPQRIGLSATVRPPDEAAHFLTGDRPVTIVDHSARAHINLRISVPLANMDSPPSAPEHTNTGGAILGQIAAQEHKQNPQAPRQQAKREQQGMWASVHPKVLDLILACRTTIVFVNSRSLCERMAQRLNEMGGDELVRAHHGSLSLRQRSLVEEALKSGTLRGIVATSSLELGIDMGAVDQVVLIESPGSVARGLQRIGRAGHQVGAISQGMMLPKHRGDLLECAVVGERMRAGELEPIQTPNNPLDVLAQHLVALCLETERNVDDLWQLVKRAYPYRSLGRESLVGLLDMLSGTYPSDEFADIRPHLRWDRETDRLSARRGAQLTTVLNAGVIVDRGSFGVFLAGDGPRVGELDEEMVHETRKGDVFLLGASSWRVEEITRDKVLVSPAPGEPGRMPFWRGEGPGRPIALGRAVGEMTRRLGAMAPDEADSYVQRQLGLDTFAAANLVQYIADQKEATGSLPSDRCIVIERFIDEVGDWRVCILTPFGSRVHAPWALALEAMFMQESGYALQTLYTDDGIILRFAESAAPPSLERLLPDPETLQDLLVEQLSGSALFATIFRQNAARALLLPRRRAQGRTPLWQQRLRAKTLLAAAQRYPSFPIVLETYRHCLQDIFDLGALKSLLKDISSRQIRVLEVETRRASPFARSLAFAYVAEYLYAGDAPQAERRAHALTLDREMLRDLLGQVEVAQLIDLQVLETMQAELQRTLLGWQARDADELHSVLNQLGDLCADEVSARIAGACPAQKKEITAELVRQRRAFWVRIGGQERLAASEDFARLRDALGVVTPSGLPQRLLGTSESPLTSLVRRWARTHGPFLADTLAQRLGLGHEPLGRVLSSLHEEGTLTRGVLHPDSALEHWCDVDVLKRLKRMTLAHARKQVAAVDATTLAHFLPRWHGLDEPRAGAQALEEIIHQLAGMALPLSTLCSTILPARIRDFSLDMLDLLCATGAVVWVGAGALASRDGRIALYGRVQAQTLIHEPQLTAGIQTPVHDALLSHLELRRACFTVELQQALGQHTKTSDIDQALWDLVWAGHVTNDTFMPLRQCLGGARRSKKSSGFGGRWTRVVDLIGHEVTPERRALATATTLLNRYGVVSRQSAQAADSVGGFGPAYAALKTMEEAGKVLRGYFIEGLGGAQFGWSGAIERLRTGPQDLAHRGPQPPLALAAVDPANPFGALIPWPPRPHLDGARSPRRVAGAQVIIHGTRLLAYLEANGSSLLLFTAATNLQEVSSVCQALRPQARKRRGQSLTIKLIDGEPALRHPAREVFEQAGMVKTFDGLSLCSLSEQSHA